MPTPPIPDSSTVNLTTSQLDSLLKCSVRCVIEEYQAHVQEEPITGRGLLILFSLSFVALLIYLIRTYKRKRKELWMNFLWAGIGCILLGILCFALYKLGYLHPPNKKGFFVSHADILLVTVSIIAFVGAIWAVLARIDAERAFNESIETRLSFGDSFDFLTIFDEEKRKGLPTIISKIGEKDFTVSLYIGFPCIGYFYKRNSTDDDKKRIDIDKIKNNFYGLIQKLDKIADDTSNKSFTLNLGIFNEAEINECFKKKNPDGTYTQEPVEILYKPKNSLSHEPEKNLLEDWKKVIEKLEDKRRDTQWSATKRVKLIYFKREDERFRFASISQQNGHEQNTLIWVVPDFYYTNTIEFNSAGFQTQSINVITMLEKVFTMDKHMTTA